MLSFLGQGGLGGQGMGGLLALIMPISFATMFLSRPAGPIRKLISAGALGPDTARRSRAVGIPREYVLRPHQRLGVVVRLEDGRWYVERRRDRLVRVITFLLILMMAVVLCLVVWLMRTDLLLVDGATTWPHIPADLKLSA